MIPSSILFQTIKAIGAVLVFLTTLEICARIEDLLRYNAPLWSQYTSECLKGTDSEGISYNIPNARFQKWRNNAHGFRGPEISLTKTPGTVRVVCLGASESYGFYEEPDKEWPAQLRVLLPSPRYQVINASVVGLGLGSYESYLKKRVLELEPDIIICFVNPLFYATGFERRQGQQGAAPKTGGTIAAKESFSVIRFIASNSRSLPKIKQVLKQSLKDSLPGLLRRYQVWSLQKQIESAEMAHLGGEKPKDAVSTVSVESFSNDLARLVSFLESRNINVILSTYPALICRDNVSAYPDIFLDNRRFFVEYSLCGILDILEKYNAAIRSTAVRQGVMFVDCRASVPKNDRYFGDNVHYTDQGARLVAEAIASAILGRPAHSTSPLHGRAVNLQ